MRDDELAKRTEIRPQPFPPFWIGGVPTRVSNVYEGFVLVKIVASKPLKRTLFNLKTMLTAD